MLGIPGDKWKLVLTNYPYQPVQGIFSQPMDSARLQQLIKMVKGSDTSTFWQKVTETPLTEHYDAHHKRVIFLWRGAKANAYILGAPSGQHDPMAQLNGTDIWFRSYIVPSDTLSQYKIAPDIPQIDAAIPESASKRCLVRRRPIRETRGVQELKGLINLIVIPFWHPIHRGFVISGNPVNSYFPVQ